MAGKPRKPQKDNITVVGMLILEDGSIIPLEEATEEQLRRFRERAAARGQAALNAYYAQHPEEYVKLPLWEGEDETAGG